MTGRAFLLGAIALGAAAFFSVDARAGAPNSIYYGAFISVSSSPAPGRTGTAPWNFNGSTYGVLNAFEYRAGKKVSLIHIGWAWKDGAGNFQSFPGAPTRPGDAMDMIRAHGAIPILSWFSWQLGQGLVQPAFSLKTLYDYNGTGRMKPEYEQYVVLFATQAKAWGHPFFMIFNEEMNGCWYPWGTQVVSGNSCNGNTADDYVRSWRAVHDIFEAQGATNVTWVWSVNTEYPGSTPIEQLYPGDAYVDWTNVNGFNSSSDKSSSWMTFTQLYTSTYDKLTGDHAYPGTPVAPTKPVMITGIGSSKDGGSKSAWIADAVGVQIPDNFTRIRALAWFNWDSGSTKYDWPIEGNSYDLAQGAPVDQASIDAFAAAVGQACYATNIFGTLSVSPIPPPGDAGIAPAAPRNLRKKP